jgi:multimeric flavodoxin WrbA
MNALYISGSPRRKSNTDYLLKLTMSITGGQFVKLADYHIEPCNSCHACIKLDNCIIKDDMTNILTPMLFDNDVIVLGSPVYFNSVSSQLKVFIDRTWFIRNKLKNKIGGTIVVGRRYGAENAITTINAFFLKHEMIVADRGVSGIAFEREEILQDREAIEAAKKLGERIKEIGKIFGY